MNTRTAWTTYILLRLAFLVVPFAALMLIGWPWWLSLAIAALVSVSLSVIFLSKQRSAASESIYEWRNRERTADDIVEDEYVDAAASDTGQQTAAPEAALETATGSAGDEAGAEGEAGAVTATAETPAEASAEDAATRPGSDTKA